ncbi:MAG: P-type conjugative transfer protein TrbL [Desulfobulbus sp.]
MANAFFHCSSASFFSSAVTCGIVLVVLCSIEFSVCVFVVVFLFEDWSQPAIKNIPRQHIKTIMRFINKALPFILLLIVAGVQLVPVWSFAADISTDTVEQIHGKFQEKSIEYGTKLKGYALGLFKLFLLVGVVVFGLQAALGRVEIADVIKDFIVMMTFAAFCYVAILYHQDWTGYILEKTNTISQDVGGTSLTLSPIDTGFKILESVQIAIESLPSWSVSALIQGLGYIVIAGIILCCFVIMTARILVVLCEAYIAMNAAILLLGFGAASFMKEYAINVMRYTISVAFKLLVMQLLLGVGMAFIDEFSVITQVDFQTLFILLACVLILLVLIQTIPETVAGIINGSHVGGGVGLKAAAGAALGAMAGTIATTSQGIGGTAGAARTVSRAAKIASLQGDGGIRGTASQLWRSAQDARHDEMGMGWKPTVGSTTRRMRSNLYNAQRAAQTYGSESNSPATSSNNEPSKT